MNSEKKPGTLRQPGVCCSKIVWIPIVWFFINIVFYTCTLPIIPSRVLYQPGIKGSPVMVNDAKSLADARRDVKAKAIHQSARK